MSTACILKTKVRAVNQKDRPSLLPGRYAIVWKISGCGATGSVWAEQNPGVMEIETQKEKAQKGCQIFISHLFSPQDNITTHTYTGETRKEGREGGRKGGRQEGRKKGNYSPLLANSTIINKIPQTVILHYLKSQIIASNLFLAVYDSKNNGQFQEKSMIVN